LIKKGSKLETKEKSMKHKIAYKFYSYECGDGCCTETGYDWYVDGEFIIRSTSEDAAWMAVIRKLGIDATLVGLDENDQEIWEL
jgi:hypothetical protein